MNAFRAILASTPEDLLPMVYLCTNRVAPAHEGLELGIGDATLIKVMFLCPPPFGPWELELTKVCGGFH